MKPKPGDTVMLTEVPQGMLDDLPADDQQAINEVVGNRKTRLRGKRCQEDINNYWMGHQPETMSEFYSRLDEDLTTRLREAEIVGVGFEVPAPSAPRNVEELELELELQEQ